ncbi:MAG: TetR/AcrR family transcriptional regulator [Shimia sp.]|uniref:TetR/AcrR family transcriptional regulator n=1 Tax=Shimia sp. TaxID=1954381 RepID=UPI0040580241
MPRPKSQSRENLLDSALEAFWKIGYHVASVGDLVRETGVSRAGIYRDFDSKENLFHACLDRYQATVVTPAFGPVEADGAGIGAIEIYLNTLLKRFENSSDFGRGCLVGNTLTQVSSSEAETRTKLNAHYDRLTSGFRQVLMNENACDNRLSQAEIDDLARYAMISVQGLWSYSRLTDDAKDLHAYCDTLLSVLDAKLHGAVQ